MPGHSYKGSQGITFSPTPPSTPVLSVDGDDVLTWTWAGAVPDMWGIFIGSATVPGDAIDSVDGTLNTYDASAVAGQTIVVRGINNTFSAFETPSSNAVDVP